MHTASSPRILLREEICANFSASRATVSTADLKNTNRTTTTKKRVFLWHAPPLLSSYLHLSIPACLHPSISVKTSSKPLLPPCPSLTLHCISASLHPNRQTAPIFSYQCILCHWSQTRPHPCICIISFNIQTPNYTQCFNWPYNYVLLVF